jgi:hypothetical protein
MRQIKLLGLSLLAVFAFGAALASMASAIEPGVLFLGTETGPTTVSVANQNVTSILTLGTVEFTCKEIEASGTIGEAGQTHSTLGALVIDYKGCTSEKGTIKCATVNAVGEKDVSGTLLLQAKNTDLHLVALLESTTLVPGILVGFLEEGTLDLTLVCGLVKLKVLGATELKVKGTNLATEEVKAIELEPTTLPCDSVTEAKLCETELNKWGVTIGGKLCPLGATAKEPKDEVCSTYTSPAVKATLSKKVSIDF